MRTNKGLDLVFENDCDGDCVDDIQINDVANVFS